MGSYFSTSAEDNDAAPSTSDEYLTSQILEDKTGKPLQLQSTLITACDCMIIGSYGDKYSSQVKDKVIPKESNKPGGKFLPGVSDDLEIVQEYSSQVKDKVIPNESSKPGGKFLPGVTHDLEIVQEMIRNDPHKHLAYVLTDFPGAQRPCSFYIDKIEAVLKNCQKSGALIWYTGHGEKMTGNWCFKDGVISMEDILQLYQQHFSGRPLTIVSDCCYSGQWVHRLADQLDNLKIGACGHQASKAGWALKIFASCQHNETAFDTVYAKECVFVEPTNDLMMFIANAVDIKHCGRSQTPTTLDTTKITCFSDEKLCKLDKIPQKVLWSWKDLMSGDGRYKRLQLRLAKVCGKVCRQLFWYFVIVSEDKFEDFCQVARSGSLFDLDFYSHIVFCDFKIMPSPKIEQLFCKCGPVSACLASLDQCLRVHSNINPQPHDFMFIHMTNP